MFNDIPQFFFSQTQIFVPRETKAVNPDESWQEFHDLNVSLAF